MAEQDYRLDKSSMTQGPDGKLFLTAMWENCNGIVVVPLALLPVFTFFAWGMYTVITGWGLFLGVTVGWVLVAAFTFALYLLVISQPVAVFISAGLSAVAIYFIATMQWWSP